jgi:Ca-activated chloride channel family protein
MLERGPYLTEFVNQMTRINKGRAFFVSPERLGEYILVDYVSGKQRRQHSRAAS